MVPRIDILTIFPEMFEGFLNTSIIARAIKNKQIELVIDLKPALSFEVLDKRVDDYPYGGGAGMVLMCEPIFRAVESLRKEDTKVIMLTPSGEKFTEKKAQELSKFSHIIMLCGHYEGFDERIKTITNIELSIGDYVLTGGELPAMVITDAITRLIPGVISSSSLLNESFNDEYVDYPNYTRPEDFRGMKVPEVLLSGHHANINKYRQEERIKLTKSTKKDGE